LAVPRTSETQLANEASTHTGTCFCGAVAIEVTGAPLEMGYCHCRSCRAYSGGPMSAFILLKAGQVRVIRGAEQLGRFAKTGMSHRRFCMHCGGHVMTEHPDMGCTDVRPGALPTLEFRPVAHLNYAESVLPVKDGLPKLKDFPAHAGGSGVTLPE
jgi:hypothetical protein